MTLKALSPEELTCACSDSEITRGPIPDEAPLLPGQHRGLEALKTGLGVRSRWFNITATGATGSGKTSTIQEVVAGRAAQEPPGTDVCIHQNFANPYKPGVLYLPPGGGAHLNRLIDEFLTLLDKQIPNLLEQPTIKAHSQELQNTYSLEEQKLSREVDDFAAERSIAVQTSAQGVNLIPLLEGRPMKEEEYFALEPGEREDIDRRRKDVLQKMAENNPQILALERQKREAIDSYIKNAITDMVHGYLGQLRSYLQETPQLTGFMDALEAEIIDKRFLFLSESTAIQPFGGAQLHVMRQTFSKQCRLNVVVDRSGETSAPVVVENNPTFNNLIGGVDFTEEQGVLKADFTQIRGGSLLQASGGYLVLQAIDLVQQPTAYQALKRALRTGQVKLRDQFTEMGFRSGVHLEPDPVEVSTKVIIVGDESLIQYIQAADDEFARLFKINADFSRTLMRTPEVMQQFVSYLEFHARQNQVLPLALSGIARLIEEASRQVAHQNRLSGQVSQLLDLLIETDHLARNEGRAEIDRELLNRALEQRKYRHSKIEEVVRREISEGTILLDVTGEQVGQVNALAVYQAGRMPFGVPTRITSQAYAGRAGIINIEREADLSGRIHTKAVLILNGYLGRLFARKRPLALSISICFEQNYGGIEGDSATAAEFFAIISAISQVPLKQHIAVTGSMNQHGAVQPIGGVNEKIGGFFQFVKEHGFPEGCGVMIPETNKVNLMLDAEIIAAVQAGRFHVYPVSRIEDGLEIMTGQPTGALVPDGSFTPGSVYATTMERLQTFLAHTEREKAKEEEPDRP